MPTKKHLVSPNERSAASRDQKHINILRIILAEKDIQLQGMQKMIEALQRQIHDLQLKVTNQREEIKRLEKRNAS